MASSASSVPALPAIIAPNANGASQQSAKPQSQQQQQPPAGAVENSAAPAQPMQMPATPANLSIMEESAVQEFLSLLEQYQERCEREHMYVEAQVAAKRLAELRSHELKRRQESLYSRHIAEKLDLEEVHLREIEVLAVAWAM